MRGQGGNDNLLDSSGREDGLKCWKPKTVNDWHWKRKGRREREKGDQKKGLGGREMERNIGKKEAGR